MKQLHSEEPKYEIIFITTFCHASLTPKNIPFESAIWVHFKLSKILSGAYDFHKISLMALRS